MSAGFIPDIERYCLGESWINILQTANYRNNYEWKKVVVEMINDGENED